MTQNTEFSHSEQRRGRVKMAQAVLNMHALHEEMELYDLSSLQKSASAGRSQEQRIKYAALRFQYELEKQAVIGAVLRAAAKSGLSGLKGLAGKGLKGLKMGYNPAMRVSAGLAGKVAPVTTGTIRGARAGASAAKGVGAGTVGTAKGAFGGARRGAIDAIRQNPKSTAASAGLLGYELLNQGGRGRGRSPSPQAPALPPPVATGGAAGLPLQGSRRSDVSSFFEKLIPAGYRLPPGWKRLHAGGAGRPVVGGAGGPVSVPVVDPSIAGGLGRAAAQEQGNRENTYPPFSKFIRDMVLPQEGLTEPERAEFSLPRRQPRIQLGTDYARGPGPAAGRPVSSSELPLQGMFSIRGY